MQHCEERFLHLGRHYGIIKPSATSMSLSVRFDRPLMFTGHIDMVPGCSSYQRSGDRGFLLGTKPDAHSGSHILWSAQPAAGCV